MIVLHQFEISPFCDKVRRVLHVKGQPYEIREIPPSRTLSWVRQKNPAGKLPFVEVDGQLIADSTDISLWLEERFPEPRLVPKAPRDRALCLLLEDWADESLYFYEATLRFTWPENAARWVPELTKSEPPWLAKLAGPLVPLAVRTTVRAQGTGRKSRERIAADLSRLLLALEDLLGSEPPGEGWLVGGALSLADLAVFTQLACIRGTPVGAAWLGERPRVSAWMERVDAASGRRP